MPAPRPGGLRAGFLACVVILAAGTSVWPRGKARAEDAAATPEESATPDTAVTPETAATPDASPTAGNAASNAANIFKDAFDRAAGPMLAAITRPVDEIGEDDERALGQATALQIIRDGGGLMIEDAPLVRYVNRVGNLVAQQGHRAVNGPDGKPRPRSRDFVFGVLDDDAINAYSTPGGYVFVTRGLVRQLGSESELAWVLGHEIAHVDLEHGLAGLKTYLRERKVAITFADATGDVNARARWQNATFFRKMAAKSAEISHHIKGKKEERAADALGLRYAAAAGYDAAGGLRVLERMMDLDPGPSLFATHDPPYQRLLALRPLARDEQEAPGYAGKVGTMRFTRDCIDRLDAIDAAREGAPR